MDRERLRDRWSRALPPRLAHAVTLPVGRQLHADDGFRWGSVKMLNDAFGYVANEGIPGDYAEFGVLRGRVFLEAWLAAERYRLSTMQLRAYDSFEGLPEVSGIDRGGPFSSGQFASSRSAFEQTVARVPRQRLSIVEGFFDATLPKAQKRPVAVAWVDCDLYESTVPVLDYLTDQLQDGSVLIFDDWFCFRARPDKGEQRACREWLEQHSAIRLVEYRDFHWAGRSFIVNRTDEQSPS